MANRIELPFVVDCLVEISEGKFASTPVVGATVTIKRRTSELAVSVYETEKGEVAIVPTTDREGRIQGWVEEGAYTITVTGGIPYIAATEYAWDALSGRGIENPRVGEGVIWRKDLRKDENYNDTQSVLEALIPTGTILSYGGTVSPAGFLLTDGKAYSTETYNRLFKVIGYEFGKPEAGKFAVPNTLGRSIIGTGSGAGLTARTIGEKGGAETIALTAAQLASHSHGVTDPSHRHVLTNESNTPLNIPYVKGGNANPSEANMNSSAGYNNGFVVTSYNTTGITVNATGEGQAHPNMHPFSVLTGIIKT
jgi:microcystin-dependent protein